MLNYIKLNQIKIIEWAKVRISQENREFIRGAFDESFDFAELYLFGSRLDDTKKGGDIDLLIISEKKLDFLQISNFRILLLRRLGDRKIDIVNFTYDNDSSFFKLIKHEAEKI